MLPGSAGLGACLLLASAALPLLAGCSPLDPVEGVFRCDVAADCPLAWSCELRAGQVDKLCYMPATNSSLMDASTSAPTNADPFANTPGTSGGRPYPDVDAASQYACGSWKAVRYTDTVPTDAVGYGYTYTGPMARGFHYVCRFPVTVDGKMILLQGKGAFGYSCSGVAPPSATLPARVRVAQDFEVLVDTGDCAGMLPFNKQVRMMPTGFDANDDPTFSCRAFRESIEVPGQKNAVLGRFESQSGLCLYDWYGNPASQADDFEVLSAP